MLKRKLCVFICLFAFATPASQGGLALDAMAPAAKVSWVAVVATMGTLLRSGDSSKLPREVPQNERPKPRSGSVGQSTAARSQKSTASQVSLRMPMSRGMGGGGGGGDEPPKRGLVSDLNAGEREANHMRWRTMDQSEKIEYLKCLLKEDRGQKNWEKYSQILGASPEAIKSFYYVRVRKNDPAFYDKHTTRIRRGGQQGRQFWTQAETRRLGQWVLAHTEENGLVNWEGVNEAFPGRSQKACRIRYYKFVRGKDELPVAGIDAPKDSEERDVAAILLSIGERVEDEEAEDAAKRSRLSFEIAGGAGEVVVSQSVVRVRNFLRFLEKLNLPMRLSADERQEFLSLQDRLMTEARAIISEAGDNYSLFIDLTLNLTEHMINAFEVGTGGGGAPARVAGRFLQLMDRLSALIPRDAEESLEVALLKELYLQLRDNIGPIIAGTPG